MQKQLLIAAGGRGTRMSPESLPKQFLTLGGRPLLLHSIDAFLACDPEIHIVVVIPSKYKDLWQDICRKQGFHQEHVVAEGGPTRFHSVKSGLRHIAPDGLVAIHDGVRPLASKHLVANVFEMARRFGNAVPAIAPHDSVRLSDHAFNEALDRQKVKLVQTPQCFEAARIKSAYQCAYEERFTDDAAVLEAQGERICLVDGERENIKVTGDSDLVVAESLLLHRPAT